MGGFPALKLPRRIWLSGSRGFIGRTVVERLQREGVDLTCVSNGPVDETGNGREVGPLRFPFRDPRQVRRALELREVPDCLLHLGWGAMTDPGSARHLTDNLEAGRTLVDACFAAGVETIVAVGTINEYGSREGSLVESAEPVGGLTNYAKAKRALAEYGFQRAAAHEKRFVEVRLSYTYGPGQRPESLVNKLAAHRRSGRCVALGPCEHYRDYIHVGDAAEGIVRLAALDRSVVVNLGGGNGAVQVRDFVQRLWRALGGSPEDLRFGALAMRAGEPDQPPCYLDLTRLRRLTGWAPEETLESGIAATAEFLLTTDAPTGRACR